MIENKFISEGNECSFLYCILHSEYLLLEAIEILKKDSLGTKECNIIYNTILDILEEGNKLVLQVLVSKLPTEINKYLDNILKNKVDISNFSYYFKVVQDKNLFRSYDNLSGYIKQSVSIIDKPEDLVQNVQTKIDNINTTISGGVSSFEQNLFDIIPNPDSYDENAKKRIIGIQSGIKALDDIVLGFHPGCFTTIAGRPSEGKSNLTRNILLYNALQNLPVLLFSMDETEEIVKMKIVSTITGINYNSLKKQELNKGDINILKKNIDLIKTLPFYIDNTPFLTPALIRARVKKLLYKQKNLCAVAVDYVQQMGVNTEEITKVSQSIKHLCNEFKIPFFVISQLSRSIENRTIDNNESWLSAPLLSDLRQSGSLEQDSDKIIFVRAEPRKDDSNLFKEKRKCRMFVSKQRDGEAGLWIDLLNIGKIQRFEEVNDIKERDILPF